MPTPRSRVTVRDIAKVTGFAPSTISLALRNSPKLAAATRERILAAATRLGYERDPRMASLMNYLAQRQRRGGHRETLAYVFPFAPTAPHAAMPFYRRCFDGARAHAHDLGYDLESFHLDRRLSPARLDGILFTRAIKGIIFAQHPVPHSRIEMTWERYATVILGYGLEHPPAHRICPDVYEGTTVCYRRLVDCGYRNIGFVIDRRKNEITRHLLRAAYLDMCHEHGRPASILEVPETQKREPALREWLDLHAIDGIVSLNRSVLAGLAALEVKVPGDCGVAIVNVLGNSELSGYRTHAFRLGRAAVDQVAADVEHNHFGLPETPLIISLAGQWQEGATVSRLDGHPRGRAG